MYPRVLNEWDTVGELCRGYSIARFGDGELKIVYGSGYAREPVNAKLTAELRGILFDSNRPCLVGVPTMEPTGPKAANWERHRARFEAVLNPDLIYVSAFISRPDSAPWIHDVVYAQKISGLWAGKRAVVVCERKGSMFKMVRLHARSTIHVECPRHRAYSVIDALEQRCVELKPDIAILSAGPTATCLANRLAPRGIQAIDLGSAGGFLYKLLT